MDWTMRWQHADAPPNCWVPGFSKLLINFGQ
jgi:hypothetical protein